MEVISVRKVLTVTDCNEGNSQQFAINVTGELKEIFNDEDFVNERSIEFFDKQNKKYILDAKYFPTSKQNRLKNQYIKFINDNSLKSGDFLIMTRYRCINKETGEEKRRYTIGYNKSSSNFILKFNKSKNIFEGLYNFEELKNYFGLNETNVPIVLPSLEEYKIIYLGNGGFRIDGLDINSIRKGNLVALVIDRDNKNPNVHKIEVGLKEYTIVKICEDY